MSWLDCMSAWKVIIKPITDESGLYYYTWVQENIRKVTTHLHKKLIQIPGCNPDKEILTLIPTVA